MKKYLIKSKFLFVLTIIISTIICFSNVIIAFVLQAIIDCAEYSSISKLLYTSIMAISFVVIRRVIVYFNLMLQNKYIYKTMVILKQDIFTSIIHRDIKTFREENSANYISTLTNDMKLVESNYFNAIFSIFSYALTFIFGCFSMISINPLIFIFVLVTSSCPLIPSFVFGKKVGEKNKTYSDNISKFTAKIKDLFSGFEVIKGFNIETKANDDYEKVNVESEKSKYDCTVFESFVNVLAQGLGDISFYGTTIIGIYFVLKGKMTVGSVIAATQLMNCIVNPIIGMNSFVAKLKSIEPINEKILALIGNKKSEDNCIAIKEFKDNIKFDNVVFGYTSEKNILNGLTLEIKKGEKYAVVGGSGSGKSTLLKLLLRFYDDFKGQITIDNINVTNISHTSLYNIISTIQQNVFMFDDTIENNIMLYNSYDESILEEVIDKSGLRKLVDSLPQKQKSMVGENGNNLSGGEKQRIAIARALIKNTPILILDEATSSLDNENAYNIEDSILSIDELTCLVVTHKLNKELLEKYDKIVVLNNGIVEEIGSYDELINKKGYFYNLYNVAGAKALK